MSTLDINKLENGEDNKTPDKKQIEAEEKEMMLKATDNENIEAATELKPENEGPVKAALSGDVTEQGREVKPKFIPIGAIKMPGFFTRNSDKSKVRPKSFIVLPQMTSYNRVKNNYRIALQVYVVILI